MYEIITDTSPATPLGIFNRILRSHEELAPLKSLIEDSDCKLAFLFKEGELKFRGELAAGLAALPDAQGAMKPLFAWLLEGALGYAPDWLIILSKDWWDENREPLTREALVFHEALHCGQQRDKWGMPRFNASTGMPVIGLLPHDVEEFHAVVQRYGAWTPDLVEFRDALNSTDTSQKEGRDGSLSVSGLRVVNGGRK